jgi:hypothetical protein
MNKTKFNGKKILMRDPNKPSMSQLLNSNVPSLRNFANSVSHPIAEERSPLKSPLSGQSRKTFTSHKSKGTNSSASKLEYEVAFGKTYINRKGATTSPTIEERAYERDPYMDPK